MNDQLEKIYQLLLLFEQKEQTLGFCEPPKTRVIYANRQYSDCLWYFWNGAKSEHEPILAAGITGYITKLEVEAKMFRNKPDNKINLHIKADRPYIIQAGVDTLFAKGLLYTLSKLPSESFRNPITIAVEPGDTEQVLFCRVYNPATGNAVIAKYPDDTNWVSVLDRAISKSNSASSETPKPETPKKVLPSQPGEVLIENELDLTIPEIQSAPIWAAIVKRLKQCSLQSEVDKLLSDLKSSEAHWSIVRQYDAELTVEAEFSTFRRKIVKPKAVAPVSTGSWD